MATAFVNAKIDRYTKERVDEILKREKRTASEIIKAMWSEIARTGKLPANLSEREEAARQALAQEKIKTLHAAIGRSTLPAEYVNRDAQELLGDLLMERHNG